MHPHPLDSTLAALAQRLTDSADLVIVQSHGAEGSYHSAIAGAGRDALVTDRSSEQVIAEHVAEAGQCFAQMCFQPLTVEGAVLGMVELYRWFSTRSISFDLTAFAEAAGIALAAAHQAAHYQRLAWIDPHTGAYTLTWFTEFLADSIAANACAQQPVSLIAWDVDNLKLLNEWFGHVLCDRLLTLLICFLQHHLPEASIARFAGDEFVVCLPGMSAADAQALACRLQTLIDTTPFRVPLPDTSPPAEQEVCLGISLGSASYPQDAPDGDGLLEHALLRMQADKKRRRARATPS
ncbi:MAG: diguanylate cyclase and serine/threonine protein kinase with repeat [Chthonomonadales bacterium]|nr:diguanylate cyclase and serine/threonine protein kinase with repeat [Chthonomonadales bacterium]